MNVAARVACFFAIHVAFLFSAYGSHFFRLDIPYNLAIFTWLGISSLLAALAYRSALAKSKVLGAAVGGEPIPSLFAILAAGISLFVGVFLALNTYGTSAFAYSAVDLAPFGRRTPRDKAAQRRSASHSLSHRCSSGYFPYT